MGSYTNELKKYVDPSSNHPLPNHDTDHLYKIRETVTGNLFGYYKMNDQAENVVVFSNKYFSKQYKILSKKGRLFSRPPVCPHNYIIPYLQYLTEGRVS